MYPRSTPLLFVTHIICIHQYVRAFRYCCLYHPLSPLSRVVAAAVTRGLRPCCIVCHLVSTTEHTHRHLVKRAEENSSINSSTAVVAVGDSSSFLCSPSAAAAAVAMTSAISITAVAVQSLLLYLNGLLVPQLVVALSGKPKWNGCRSRVHLRSLACSHVQKRSTSTAFTYIQQ